MRTSDAKPKIGWRIPAETLRKARIRAINLNMTPGQYVAQLIEKDCEKELEEITP